MRSNKMSAPLPIIPLARIPSFLENTVPGKKTGLKKLSLKNISIDLNRKDCLTSLPTITMSTDCQVRLAFWHGAITKINELLTRLAPQSHSSARFTRTIRASRFRSARNELNCRERFFSHERHVYIHCIGIDNFVKANAISE